MAKKLGPGDDLEMIKNPMLWPHWPLLPVKRHTNGKGEPVPDSIECGLLLAVKDRLTTVFKAYLFHLPPTVKDIIEDPKIERIEYKTHEELLADGWRVD